MPEAVGKLVEILPSEWPTLQQMYKRNWPRYMGGFYILDTCIRWTQLDSTIKHLKIYSLDGDWRDGTFVCQHRYEIFPNTLSESSDRLRSILLQLDWTIGLRIGAIRPELQSRMLDVVDSMRATVQSIHLTHVYHMPAEQALRLDEIKCPEHIELRALSHKHADNINNLWPIRHSSSAPLIRQFIELNPCLGAYDRTTGDLLAWCLRYQPGALGILQVEEQHRRRGLGVLVCRQMTEKLAKMGADPFAYILPENVASRQLFERLGYAHADDSYWIQTRPIKGFVWQD